MQAATAIVTKLREDGILTTPPFTRPIDFVYFDLWHYDGRTSKHGAFMGGADFVQWHGNYPMLARTVELQGDVRRPAASTWIAQRADWQRDHQLWIEAFVLFNMAGLAGDIFLAHSRERGSRTTAEYIPLYLLGPGRGSFSRSCSCCAGGGPMPGAMSVTLWAGSPYSSGWRAWSFISTAGFSRSARIRSLTYAAPFAAPLAYTGLGLLLIVEPTRPPESHRLGASGSS